MGNRRALHLEGPTSIEPIEPAADRFAEDQAESADNGGARTEKGDRVEFSNQSGVRGYPGGSSKIRTR